MMRKRTLLRFKVNTFRLEFGPQNRRVEGLPNRGVDQNKFRDCMSHLSALIERGDFTAELCADCVIASFRGGVLEMTVTGPDQALIMSVIVDCSIAGRFAKCAVRSFEVRRELLRLSEFQNRAAERFASRFVKKRKPTLGGRRNSKPVKKVRRWRVNVGLDTDRTERRVICSGSGETQCSPRNWRNR